MSLFFYNFMSSGSDLCSKALLYFIDSSVVCFIILF